MSPDNVLFFSARNFWGLDVSYLMLSNEEALIFSWNITHHQCSLFFSLLFIIVAVRFFFFFLHQYLLLTYLIFKFRMQRNKGQFTSAKKQDGGNSWGSDQESVQDAVQSETS